MIQQQIRELIQHSPEPQRRIAERAQMAPESLNRFVRGKASLNGRSLDRLAEAIGADVVLSRQRQLATATRPLRTNCVSCSGEQTRRPFLTSPVGVARAVVLRAW